MSNIRYHEEQLTPVCIAVYRDCYDSAAAAEKEGGVKYIKVMTKDIVPVLAGIETACAVIGEQVGHEIVLSEPMGRFIMDHLSAGHEIILSAPWNRTSTGATPVKNKPANE